MKRCLSVITLAFALVVAAGAQTTVFGGLGPGLGQTVNPFDSAVQQQQKIAGLIQQTNTKNSDAKVAYLLQAADWVTNAVHARDLGQPITPAPTPPAVIHVDPVTGVQTSGPDLVASPPVLPAPVGNLGSNGALASSSPAPDRIDQIMAGLAALWNVIQQMQAELVSIKAKVAP